MLIEMVQCCRDGIINEAVLTNQLISPDYKGEVSPSASAYCLFLSSNLTG
jgi:hypothetical protein